MAAPDYRGAWDDSALAELLGWKVIREEAGHCRAEFEATEQFLNPRGAVQGGMLAAMLDAVISAAVRSSLEAGQSPRATLEMKVNFIGAAQVGGLLGEGKVVHRGKSVAFAEGSLTTPDGDLIATASATMRIYTESTAS